MLEPEIYILITAPSGSQVVRSYTERSPAEQVKASCPLLITSLAVLIVADTLTTSVHLCCVKKLVKQVYDDLNLEFGRGALRLSGQTKIRGRQEALRAGYYTFQVITRVPVTWQQAGGLRAQGCLGSLCQLPSLNCLQARQQVIMHLHLCYKLTMHWPWQGCPHCRHYGASWP